MKFMFLFFKRKRDKKRQFSVYFDIDIMDP